MDSKYERVAWREKRQNVHLLGRDMVPEDEQVCLSQPQVVEAAKSLASDKEKRMAILHQLASTFVHKPELIQYFLKINTSLPTLMSLLSGSNIDLQLQTLTCLTNMAGATQDDVNLICKVAAPYLVTYLSSSNHNLQDQCAWCVGNLAADSQTRCEHFISLGVPQLLIKHIQSSSPGVVQSAIFALLPFAKSPQFTGLLVREGIFRDVECHLVSDSDDVMILTQVSWLLYYLTARTQYLPDVKSSLVPEKLALCFITVTQDSPHKHQLLTPLVRSLGNMCCDLHLATRILQCDGLLTQIGQVMTSAPDVHIRKEVLWLLTNLCGHAVPCLEVVSSGIIPHVIHSLASTHHIKIQACECLCNLACSSGYSEIVKGGGIQSVVPLLAHPLPDVALAALYLTELLVNSQHTLEIFTECGGRVSLETVVNRPNNSTNMFTDTSSPTITDGQLSSMARDLLALYYQS